MRQPRILLKKMGGEQDNVQRICGDGLSVQLDSNECILEVTGDGCRITMGKNCGSIRVVGDGCHLKIGHNVGDIEYNGDGGQVQLGPKSSKENVRYIGDGGKVTFETERRSSEKSREKQKLKNLQSKSAKTKINSNGLNDKDQETSSITPEMENILNTQKEMEQQIYRNYHWSPRKNKQFEKNIIVKNKTVTNIRCDDCTSIKKWFINPGLVIKGYHGDCVKLGCKGSKGST